MPTFWRRLDTVIHDWGYYFLRNRTEVELPRAGQRCATIPWAALLASILVLELCWACVQRPPKWTRKPTLKVYVSMVYLPTSRPFIFTRMIQPERSLPLMRRCKQAAQEKRSLQIWYVARGFPIRVSEAWFSSIVTNKVFTVILFAYVEGLAASVEASRERPPGSPVSLLFSDLVAKISNASPDQFLARSATVEQWHRR